MVVTLETSQLLMSPENTGECPNILFISVTLETSQLEIFPLKFVAPSNIQDIPVIVDTSQFLKSALKEEAPLNIAVRSVTLVKLGASIALLLTLEQSLKAPASIFQG